MPPKGPANRRTKRLPIRVLGYRPSEVDALVAEIEAEQKALAADLEAKRHAREAELRRVQERERTLTEVLAHLKAETTLLHVRVTQARQEAPYLQEAARHEVERLRQAAEVRMNDLQQAITAVEAAIRRTDEDLASTAQAVARGIGQAQAPRGSSSQDGVDQTFSDVAAAVFGGEGVEDLVVDQLEGDLFRAEVREAKVRLQTREAPVGTLSALLLSGHPLAIVGYETQGPDGSPLGCIPAADVLAVRRGSVIVKDVSRFLDARALPPQTAFTLHPVTSENRSFGPGSLPDLPTPQSPAPGPRDAAGTVHTVPPLEPSERDTGLPASFNLPTSANVQAVDIDLGDVPTPAAAPEAVPAEPSTESDDDVAIDIELDAGPIEGGEPIPDLDLSLDPPAIPLGYPVEVPPDLVVAQEVAVTSEGVPASEGLPPDDVPAPPRTDPSPPPATPGVGRDVLAFLEGKVVGAAIYDRMGVLVAASGERITPDLVSRVEAAGRLPDLIVHMALHPDDDA